MGFSKHLDAVMTELGSQAATKKPATTEKCPTPVDNSQKKLFRFSCTRGHVKGMTRSGIDW